MKQQITNSWRYSLLLILLFYNIFPSAFGKDVQPRLKLTKFDFMPYSVNYFSESDVLLFIDPLSNDVYHSTDAGESWSIPKDIPRGIVVSLVMHPWSPMRAYIITEDQEHWTTDDRGQTWRSFIVDRFPSLYRDVMVFHAGDPDKIIWNGMDCSGIFCDEVVSINEA